MAEAGTATARCLCMRPFTAPTEHEALRKLRKHVEAMAATEELHGLRVVSSDNLTIPEALIETGLQEEVQRLLEERNNKAEEEPSWQKAAVDLELTRQMLRWSVMHLHEGMHSERGGSWRNCRHAVCLHAQMVLPEVEEVEWT